MKKIAASSSALEAAVVGVAQIWWELSDKPNVTSGVPVDTISFCWPEVAKIGNSVGVAGVAPAEELRFNWGRSMDFWGVIFSAVNDANFAARFVSDKDLGMREIGLVVSKNF